MIIRFKRRKELLARAAEEAVRGRQLAIYDRATGLMAKWYLILRCEEECYRAIRYKRPLTLVLVEAVGDNYLNTAGELVHWFNTKGRRTDLRAQLGDGSFVVLLAETDVDGAAKLARRLEKAIPRIFTGIGSHPYDGGNFDQLLAAAQSRIDGSMEHAA
jgi:GGDEF domain-containing protein